MRALLPLLLLASIVRAGGSPETTLVVVNKNSPLSRLVANDYMKLRDIPAGHVVYVDGIPHLGVIELELFLERIWKPIEQRIKELGGPIRLVTYSADFPYGVRFLKKRENQGVGTVASLNGLTYLIKHVKAGEAFFNLQINPYYGLTGPKAKRANRRATSDERNLYMQAQQAVQKKQYAKAAKAFEALLATYEAAPQPWYNYACCLARLKRNDDAIHALGKAVDAGWANAGHTAQDPDLAPLRGMPGFKKALGRMGGGVAPTEGFDLDGYYLSTHLAYTGFRGNSLPEIRNYLKRSAESDGTNPDGTVYILRNKNVRSTAREPFFKPLMDGLKSRGRKVELLDGVLPPGKDDVIGGVVGTAKFDWDKSKSKLLPGAIIEHLTSFGAHFGTPGQTKCTPFLRAGAAGSSGTVQEPLALHQKFPNPLIHVFYADGLSLAEAFYRSVHGPYQLMIIGDGMARPFAKLPRLAVEAPGGPWRGRIELKTDAKHAKHEVWIDGVFHYDGLSVDTGRLEDGHHEVRVVAIEGPAKTRRYRKLAVTFDNHALKVQDVLSNPSLGRYQTTYRQDLQGAHELQLRQGDRVVVRGKTGELKFDPVSLAPGSFALTPVWIFDRGKAWRGRPQLFEVKEDNPQTRIEVPGNIRFVAGAVGTVDGKDSVITHVGDKFTGKRLRDVFKGAKHIKVDGMIDVPADGFFQFVATGSGTLVLAGAPRKLPFTHGTWLPKGPFPFRFDFKGANLEIMLNGTSVWQAPKLVHGLAAHKKQPVKTSGTPAAAGLLLEWKRATSGIAAVVLTYKGTGQGWTIESTTTKKFKPVKDVKITAAPGYVRFDFKKKLRAKRILINARGKTEVKDIVVLK